MFTKMIAAIALAVLVSACAYEPPVVPNGTQCSVGGGFSGVSLPANVGHPDCTEYHRRIFGIEQTGSNAGSGVDTGGSGPDITSVGTVDWTGTPNGVYYNYTGVVGAGR